MGLKEVEYAGVVWNQSVQHRTQ